MRWTAVVVIALSRAVAAPLKLSPPLQTNGTAIPIVKHASLVRPDNTVDLGALHSHIAFVKAKIRRGLDDVKRRTNTNEPRSDEASLTLTGHNKALWYGTITIGTPPTPFTVDIDTGTADLFVPSVACDASCDGHARWDTRAREATAEPLGQSFFIRFAGGGRATGDLYRDNVTIGGLTADEQTIGAAKKYSSHFSKRKFPPDGRLGLAFHTLGRQPRDLNLFETLISEGKVAEPVFSLWFTATGGELYLGGSNHGLYGGDLVYTPVTKQGYWEVKMQYVKGNGKPILRDVDAIIDSGANLIFGRAQQVNTFHTRLWGKAAPSKFGHGVYTFPCDTFPTVSLMFGGTDKSFPITALNLGRVSVDSPDCVSGMVEIDDATPFWILGGVFLQSVYTAFDVGNKQVGFGTPVGEGSNSESETAQTPG